ncbi:MULTISPECIES: PTS sugar transporter subunit IIB [Sporolactobacillus]|uniref:PTS system, ascorbate-specific IIB component n=1 Tax=Sporolactobacillus nakayamae TaxID=269670 RepID=A0A1I2VAE5_9BACL|nr:PTS sugar transporter subunit IIB [Sporolactobacillus nakayamae]SFG84091.1 PTS system, ascorbate-specific IIB component [Sporolactobacillus nakayamae]
MLKIATVCGAGVGSSMMLKVFAQQILDQKGVEAEVTATDISSVDPHAYDALITASAFADLLDPTATRIIRIDNMLDKIYLKQQLEIVVADIAGSDHNS